MNNGQKKIKVAFVLGALSRGGTESLILDICRNVDNCPFEVMCIYRKEGNLSEEFHKTNARLICMLKRGNILKYIFNLRQLIQEEKIDILHSQTPSNTMVLGLAIVGLHTKLITSFHGHSFAHSNYLLRKYVYNVSRKIVCVSNNQKQYYQTNWKLPNENKIEVVYNGIDTSKFNQEEYTIPDLLKDSQAKFNFVVVGSFCSGRSQDFLLKVISNAQELLRRKGVKIYFVGGAFNGEEYLYQQCAQYIIDSQISDIAIMLGVRNDVLAILHHVDGFLYSTKTDTFGIAVVEAMMCGVPVVANDYVVMQEITHNGEYALLYQTNNIEDCSQKIQHLLENIEQHKEKSKSLKEEIKHIYSIDNHINNLMHIYNNL